MSYEIYSEIMKGLPHTYTEGSDDDLGTEYSSVLEMTPGLVVENSIREENSLKYSNRSDNLEIPDDPQVIHHPEDIK